jgi:hypothetical protein
MRLLVSYFDVFNNRCPRNCNSKGTCSDGKCQCNTGYLLRDCSLKSDVFLEKTEKKAITILPGLYGYAIIPVQEIFTETAMKLTNFEAPLEGFISSISLAGGDESTQNSSNTRLLISRKLAEGEGGIEGPPNKNKFDFEFKHDNSSFTSLGEGTN